MILFTVQYSFRFIPKCYIINKFRVLIRRFRPCIFHIFEESRLYLVIQSYLESDGVEQDNEQPELAASKGTDFEILA